MMGWHGKEAKMGSGSGDGGYEDSTDGNSHSLGKKNGNAHFSPQVLFLWWSPQWHSNGPIACLFSEDEHHTIVAS